LMVNEKFVVAHRPENKAVSWFEFILPDDKHVKGQVYKYRESQEPRSLRIYISRVLPKLLDQAFDFTRKKAAEAPTTETKKYCGKVHKNLELTCKKLQDHGFKNGTIRECEDIFMNEDFGENVDQIEDIIGVGNGVLKLGKCPKLIDHHHTFPVTKYSKTEYHPYDPNNKMIQRIEKIFRDLFPSDEQDVYEFMMCWLASSLDFKRKEELILLIRGPGCSGKSMLSDMLFNALGEEFVYMANSSLLTDKTDKSGAQEDLKKFQYSRANFYDETGGNVEISDLKIKKYLNGHISTRGLYEKQTSFYIKGIHTSFSNYDFIFPH